MSINARQLSKCTEDAIMASRRGDFKTAAELYFKAAEHARVNLRDDLLAHLYQHYSYVEDLRDAGGRDQQLIESIVDNLTRMVSAVPDDRLPDKITPILNYFEALRLCCAGNIEGISQRIAELRAITDKSPHYLDSLAHVLCESMQIMECIDSYERGVTTSKNEVEERKVILLECIRKRQRGVAMPLEIARSFETFGSCLENVSNELLAIETCIQGFDRLLTNPNHKILYFLTEAIRAPIASLLSHYQTTEKRSGAFISELMAMLKGQPEYDIIIVNDSEIKGSFLDSPRQTGSQGKKLIMVNKSSVTESFRGSLAELSPATNDTDLLVHVASLVEELNTDLRTHIVDQSQAVQRMEQLLKKLDDILGKSRSTKIVRELGLSSSPPFINAGIKLVREDELR